MDLFVLLDPSAAMVSDDDSEMATPHDDFDDTQNCIKRHMPNSPPRPSLMLRKKSRQGSPNRKEFKHEKANSDLSSLPTLPPTPTTAERIHKARARRVTMETERIESIAHEVESRTNAALIRAESHLQSKVIKATRYDERLSMVQEKKLFMENERRAAIQTDTEKKTEEALRRAESKLEQRRSRARPSIDRIAAVRERKLSFENKRSESLQSEIEAKAARAEERAKENLRLKQNRARQQARIARVKARRSLQEYERRSALLSSLDDKVERASKKAEELLQDRRKRAAQEIRRARQVSSKVKAARTIQGLVRWKMFGQERHTDFGALSPIMSKQQSAMSHNEAAVLIQSFSSWKERVVVSRFDKIDDECITPRDSLQIVTDIVKGKPSFEEMRKKMAHPRTIQAARSFLSGLGIELPGLNDRTLLSAFLIAVHPDEVLDNDDDEWAKMLATCSLRLVGSIEKLENVLTIDSSSNIIRGCVRSVKSRAVAFCSIFQLWKSADLNKLVDNMKRSAEQSWVAYLSSCECLDYISEVQGDIGAASDRDPLISLRLRHDASKSGARSHIKRLRVSLNKLVGTEEGRQIIKTAKERALCHIVDTNLVTSLKDEINEHHGSSSPSAVLEDIGNDGGNNAASVSVSAADVTDIGTTSETPSDFGIEGVPSELLANEELVHRILLTDPSDFHEISWSGEATKGSIISVENFMAEFCQPDRNGNDSVSPEQAIANNMQRAFFDMVVEQMKSGTYQEIQNMLLDLHASIRKLVPNRQDLHSYLKDEDAKGACNVSDALAVLLAAAKALGENLESPDRASSTLEWIRAGDATSDAMNHYCCTSKEQYAVASCAFLLCKAETCQMDVANFQLARVAPIIHQVGAGYKHRRLQAAYALSISAPADELKEKLPATNTWILQTLASPESQGEVVRANSASKRLSWLKTRGFVDSLLFTSSRLAMPEVFLIDSERIVHIRNEARYAVIGCAIGLHISNAARAPANNIIGVPFSSPLVEEKRQALASVLRAKYPSQNDFEVAVVNAAISFAKILHGSSSLSPDANKSLRNCVSAVLRGYDPVLKLLDNRVRQFFRSVCKWQPSTSTPLNMRTGRSVLVGGETQPNPTSTSSTKDLRVADAMKEASKSGFSLFADKLVQAGEIAYSMADVVVKSYGDEILDKLLVAAAVSTE